MADITMCLNHECPLRETCYRMKAHVNPYLQSMAHFYPDEDGSCDYYWPMEKNDG